MCYACDISTALFSLFCHHTGFFESINAPQALDISLNPISKFYILNLKFIEFLSNLCLCGIPGHVGKHDTAITQFLAHVGDLIFAFFEESTHKKYESRKQ